MAAPAARRVAPHSAVASRQPKAHQKCRACSDSCRIAHERKSLPPEFTLRRRSTALSQGSRTWRSASEARRVAPPLGGSNAIAFEIAVRGINLPLPVHIISRQRRHIHNVTVFRAKRHQLNGFL